MDLSNNVLKPLARRIGSATAGAIVSAYAITDPSLSGAIEAASIAISFLAVDLFSSWWDRR